LSKLSLTQGILPKADFTKLGMSVRQILDHPSLGITFRQYAKARMADEGILFLDDFGKEVLSTNNSHESAKRLLDLYFVDTATCAVHVSNNCRLELFDKFARKDFNSLPSLFQLATHEVFVDIKNSDTFRQFCVDNEMAKEFTGYGDTLLLDEWMVPARLKYVLNSLQNKPDLVNRIRFTCSVAEFEAAPANSQRQHFLGDNIALKYIQPGAIFPVASFLPFVDVESIRKGFYEHVLPDSRLEVLQKLALDAQVMEACRKWFGENQALVVNVNEKTLREKFYTLLRMDKVEVFPQELQPKVLFCIQAKRYFTEQEGVEGNAKSIVNQFPMEIQRGFTLNEGEEEEDEEVVDYEEILSLSLESCVESLLNSPDMMKLVQDNI
jgi:hypothetical protein